MYDGVGRRQDQKSGQLVDIGAHSLNGRERKVLFRNNGDGRFTDVAFVNASDMIEDGRGLAVLDIERDGHLDLVLRNYKQPTILLRNRGGDQSWVGLKLVGSRSNRDAVGARVSLRASGLRQTREVTIGSGYLSGSSLVQHFGLGKARRVDEVEILWPSGNRTVLTSLDTNRRHVIKEGSDPR